LKAALRKTHVAVIAEVKRSSPSKGSINATLDAAAQAEAYEKGGASAVSVLTEESRFSGSAADLADVVNRVSIPVLKKDFHVAESQLEEAVALNASAALVIVRAVEPARLKVLAASARASGLEILYEVRDETELRLALSVGAEIIGVNNRNLETLEIDRTTVERILPLIPPECIAVAESGYTSAADIESAARAGADAVLIGSVVSAASDPAAAVAALAKIPRQPRGK
jgi:indole-3-glycerol phosphate synthase